ncbi:MAG: helix-turn-helix domain-containing protein [Solirubrobacteraceae bacterium]
MNRNAASLLAPLPEEVEAVLAVLAASGTETTVKLNALAGATGLPTGHVGRHLRTLERDRLVRYSSGAWLPTARGARHAADVAGDLLPLAA